MTTIGVVAKAKESGGILVVCGAGLICATDQLKDYWMPFDGYSVRATADEEFPLSNAMNEVRKSIIDGYFCLEKCARITIHKAHQEVIGASSLCLKKRCSCKGGRCKGNCGCRRSSRTLIVNSFALNIVCFLFVFI